MAAGSAEVLYQDDPGTVKYFEPRKEAVPGSGSSFRWKFKPHSMTAFTLDRRGIAGRHSSVPRRGQSRGVESV